MDRRSRSPHRAKPRSDAIRELAYENPPPQQGPYVHHLGFRQTAQPGRRPPRPTVVPPKPKRNALYGQLPDTTSAPPPKTTGPRGPPIPQQQPDHGLYQQVYLDIDEHGWEQMEPYEFTPGRLLPQHLTTWQSNILILRDMRWLPTDRKPSDPVVEQ